MYTYLDGVMFRADCRAALSSAEQALDQVSIGAGAEPPWVYRLEAHHIGTRSQCHLELHDPQQAADYAKQTLGSLDPSAVRNKVFITVFLGMAQVQRKEIEEAARLLGDAGEVAAGNSSARLTERLQQARVQLQPGSTLPPSANSTTALSLVASHKP